MKASPGRAVRRRSLGLGAGNDPPPSPRPAPGQPQAAGEGGDALAGSKESSTQGQEPSRAPPSPLPGQWAGLEPGATALMRRCCRDSALQRCLHLFYFSIIKTQAATQPDSLAVGAGRTGSAEEQRWERTGWSGFQPRASLGKQGSPGWAGTGAGSA